MRPKLAQEAVFMTGAAFTLLSDQPVAAAGQADLLGRTAVVAELAELIRASRRSAPFTLAVYADWGMGKSSLLRQVADRFEAEAKVQDAEARVQTVWFNAWTAGRADALETLIKSVLYRLDPNALRRLVRGFGGDGGRAGWTAAVLRGLAGAVHLDRLVDEIWKQFANDARARNEAGDLLQAALREWTAGDGRDGGGRMIVVFVDDLDRCAPDVIRAVCDAVKQYLSVPGLVFVLGCDQNVIESSVGARPGTDGGTATGVGASAGAAGAGTGRSAGQAGTGARAADGRRYLEKIVQASYSIPLPTEQEAANLVRAYAYQSGTLGLFEEAVTAVVVKHAGRNPRRIKRLINRFVIEYRLDPDWRRLGPGALIRSILLQDFYPEFFARLAHADEIDPIDEFAGYRAAKSGGWTSARPGDPAREQVVRFFADHGVSVPAGPPIDDPTLAVLLAKAEPELPADYPALVHDKAFTGLLKEFAETYADQEVRAKLKRQQYINVFGGPEHGIPPYDPHRAARRVHPAVGGPKNAAGPAAPAGAPIPAGPTGSAARQRTRPPTEYGRDHDHDHDHDRGRDYDDGPSTPTKPLAGLEILWLNPRPDADASLKVLLRRRGALVRTVTDVHEAIAAMRSTHSGAAGAAHVLVTNVYRAHDDEGGFSDLEELRNMAGFHGDAIVYANLVTLERITRAAHLGARMTATTGQLYEWLEESARQAGSRFPGPRPADRSEPSESLATSADV
jgi:KAP family P-loop domain